MHLILNLFSKLMLIPSVLVRGSSGSRDYLRCAHDFSIGIDVKLRGENKLPPADRLSPLPIGTGRFDWVVHWK
jgi:hypothetical protein